MAQTLATYTTIVQNEVDDTSSGAMPVIQQDIKEVYQDIIRFCSPWITGFTTEDIDVTAGDATYTPTAFMDVVKALFKEDSSSTYRELTPITWEKYLETWINTTSSTPVHYLVNGTGIQIVPAPANDGTLRVATTAVQAELTGTSVIPDRFTEVVKNGASYKFFAFDDNPKADVYKQYYEQGKREMKLELSSQGEQIIPELY